MRYVIYNEASGEIARQGRCAPGDFDLIPVEPGQVKIESDANAQNHIFISGKPEVRVTPINQSNPPQNPLQLTANEILQLRKLLSDRAIITPGEN